MKNRAITPYLKFEYQGDDRNMKWFKNTADSVFAFLAAAISILFLTATFPISYPVLMILDSKSKMNRRK